MTLSPSLFTTVLIPCIYTAVKEMQPYYENYLRAR
jgi:hypothetical protein